MTLKQQHQSRIVKITTAKYESVSHSFFFHCHRQSSVVLVTSLALQFHHLSHYKGKRCHRC